MTTESEVVVNELETEFELELFGAKRKGWFSMSSIAAIETIGFNWTEIEERIFVRDPRSKERPKATDLFLIVWAWTGC